MPCPWPCPCPSTPSRGEPPGHSRSPQAATLQKDLEQAQARQDHSARSASDGRKRLEAERSKAEQARAACTALKQERDAATDRRKELWRKEQTLGEALKTTTSELDKAQRTLQHTMSRSQWESIAAVKRIAHEKGIQARNAARLPCPPCLRPHAAKPNGANACARPSRRAATAC